MFYYNEEADRYYFDIDGIRMGYEAAGSKGQKYCGRLLGWYRPDGWEGGMNP